MAKRTCALVLVILAALPFTAPFATLRLSDFSKEMPARAVGLSSDLESHQGYADDSLSALNACIQRNRCPLFSRPVIVESPRRFDVGAFASRPLRRPVPACSPHNARSLATALRI